MHLHSGGRSFRLCRAWAAYCSLASFLSVGNSWCYSTLSVALWPTVSTSSAKLSITPVSRQPPTCPFLAHKSLAAEHFKDSFNRTMIIITLLHHLLPRVPMSKLHMSHEWLVKNVDVYAIANRKFIEASSIQLFFKTLIFWLVTFTYRTYRVLYWAKILYSLSHSITMLPPPPFHWCHLNGKKKGGGLELFSHHPHVRGFRFHSRGHCAIQGELSETFSNFIPKPACL